jgi:hypothetical protein
MDDIILRISRHYLTGVAGIIGLGVATYLMRRYLSNTEKASNTYYTRSDEIDNIPNISALSPNAKKIYIFWNGDFNSTYLLLDYLQQDYIVHPLYIERYTIRKTLEHDQLQRYTAQYNQIKSQTEIKCPQHVLEYLEDIAKMKRQQDSETSKITNLRRIIINQYPEFRINILPTRYITIIEKDLAHSQRFYDTLRALNSQPLEYAGIELFEQASRYITHLYRKLQIVGHNQDMKIVIGYSLDSHLTKIIANILENIPKNTEKKTTIKIELPLAGISNKTIKYLATNKINKEVMRFLNSSQL